MTADEAAGADDRRRPSAARAARRVAIVDGGSFVLPYDFRVAQALIADGVEVAFFGSTTAFNGEYLDAMRAAGVEVRLRAVSGSVAPRLRGALAYVALWLDVVHARRRFDAIDLQFAALWPVDLAFARLLRRRFVFTVHNAVPHGHRSRRHRPIAALAALARRLVFVSAFSRDDFLARYGEAYRGKSRLVAHGVSPARPEGSVVPYVGGERASGTAADGAATQAPAALVFWGRVEPYKGVELFAELARSPRIRARGLALEVHGRFAPELAPLRDELRRLGVRVDDDYLAPDRLEALLARDVVFVMPYRTATQSGAMYTLLAHGRVFVATDVGDLGAFLRGHGLEALLLDAPSEAAVVAALDRLAHDGPAIAAALQRAQDASAWQVTARDIGAVYALT